MASNVLDLEEFPDILDMVRKTGEKYILVEMGKPAYVVMGMEEYKYLLASKPKGKECCSGKILIDKINSDIADWKLENEEREKDYSEYLPKKNWIEDKQCIDYESLKEKSEKDNLIEEDLSYYYDVDEEQEDERFDF